MTARTDDLGERLDRIERTLHELQVELAQIRASAAAGARRAAMPTDASVPAPARAAIPTPTVSAAWRALERGRDVEAVVHAEAALARASQDADAEALSALVTFADAAAGLLLTPEVAARLTALRTRAEAGLAARTPATPATPARPRAPVRPGSTPGKAPPPARAAVAARPAPDRAPLSASARAWAQRELTGPRLFAAGGGALMLLGVVFLFVVATNRGWVGPGARVAMGAAASLGVLVAGLVLRSRFGRLQASLAAVGVGIAGAYATLAAATILYDLLPEWGALLVAAGIAAAGAAIALAWSSQLLAGLALLGAAAAPGLVALDDGISAPAPAFALVVLAAALAVAAPRRWLWLLGAVGGTALAQVVWLVAESPLEDRGAIAVSAAASLLLLAGAVVWESAAAEEGVDPAAATMALIGAGLALGAARALLPDDREAGVALAVGAAVYGVVAIVAGRRWRNLGWVVGAAALLLAGVATADLLSGRSLSIALAIEAVVLAGLARRLGAPRFELGALAYLALGIAHVAAVELEGALELADVPRDGAAGLFSVAGAALAVALLLPARRADRPSTGLAGALEPLWDALVRDRPWIRALLAALALALAAAGSAALLSERTLTLAWSAAAAAAGLGAFLTRDRRLLAAALPLLGLAVLHALSVEAPPSTLALERGSDPLAPVASLVALGAACVALALTCRFDHRGLAFLGPLVGPERPLAEFDAARAGVVRAALLHVAVGYAVWAAGLALVEVSYDWGQVGATLLWAVLGTVFVARSAAAASGAVVAGWGVLAFAYLKSVSFDWDQLGTPPAAVSVLGVSAALLAAGFLGRWLEARAADPLELLSLAVAALATVSAGVALDRLADGDSRAFGASLLAVTAVLVGAAAPPFVRWRRRGAPTWARELATGYWALALSTLLLAEAALTAYGETRFLAAWAATATALAVVWRPLQEPWLWIAAVCVASASTAGAIALVTPPERLVEATARPGAGLSALVVCVVAAAMVAGRAPPFAAGWRAWLVGAAAAAGLYTVSLAVLDVAERVSGASIATDFQRGHTALSALLGLGALGLYVVGLARDRRPLRIAGLTLFGLALAKLFLYDLRNLSSITRALSFLALGSVLLAAAFFAERFVRGERGGAGPRTV